MRKLADIQASIEAHYGKRRINNPANNDDQAAATVAAEIEKMIADAMETRRKHLSRVNAGEFVLPADKTRI